MSERPDRRDDWKNFPKWQTEQDLRELYATQDEQEGHGGQRFDPDDERREREQRRLNPDLDDLE